MNLFVAALLGVVPIPSAGGSPLLPQILTFAIPLGVFGAVCIWIFFQRRPSA